MAVCWWCRLAENIVLLFISVELLYCTVYQKTSRSSHYCSFYKCWPISIISGTQYTEEICNTSIKSYWHARLTRIRLLHFLYKPFRISTGDKACGFSLSLQHSHRRKQMLSRTSRRGKKMAEIILSTFCLCLPPTKRLNTFGPRGYKSRLHTFDLLWNCSGVVANRRSDHRHVCTSNFLHFLGCIE